jgi:UDP-N-acetylglucosamine 1-carboxyvinyltransferase
MVVSNVPEIEDIHRLKEILEWLGVTCTATAGEYRLDSSKLNYHGQLPEDLMPKLRASNLLVGPLLARYGQVIFPHPGGCIIGKRPIDFFLHGLTALGATVNIKTDYYEITASGGLHGATFVFPRQSHTGTEMMIMAASIALGTTTLINSAMDPEVVALAEYLNACGANISGAGTPTVTIIGVPKLRAGTFSVAPDRLETSSFLAMAAATRSDLTITDCRPGEIQVPLDLLARIGVPLEIGQTSIRVKSWERLEANGFATQPYPGFPTDAQAPFIVLLTQATGTALIHETVFDGRLLYIDLLNRMGANITLFDPHRAQVVGPTPLRGKLVESPDIRAGLAMVIAGLVANGTTSIGNAYQIDRGYQSLEQRLRQVGAQIERRV